MVDFNSSVRKSDSGSKEIKPKNKKVPKIIFV